MKTSTVIGLTENTRNVYMVKKLTKQAKQQLHIGIVLGALTLAGVGGWIAWQLFTAAPFYTYKGNGYSLQIPTDTAKVEGGGRVMFNAKIQPPKNPNDAQEVAEIAAKTHSVSVACSNRQAGLDGLVKSDQDYKNGTLGQGGRKLLSYSVVHTNGTEGRLAEYENGVNHIYALFSQNATRACVVGIFTPKNNVEKWQSMAQLVMDSLKIEP